MSGSEEGAGTIFSLTDDRGVTPAGRFHGSSYDRATDTWLNEVTGKREPFPSDIFNPAMTCPKCNGRINMREPEAHVCEAQ